MEGRTLVAEALLTSAESAEVLGGLGDDVAEEVEVDATLLLCRRRNVSFNCNRWKDLGRVEGYDKVMTNIASTRTANVAVMTCLNTGIEALGSRGCNASRGIDDDG